MPLLDEAQTRCFVLQQRWWRRGTLLDKAQTRCLNRGDIEPARRRTDEMAHASTEMMIARHLLDEAQTRCLDRGDTKPWVVHTLQPKWCQMELVRGRRGLTKENSTTSPPLILEIFWPRSSYLRSWLMDAYAPDASDRLITTRITYLTVPFIHKY